MMTISVLNACGQVHEPAPPKETHPSIEFSRAAVKYAQKVVQGNAMHPTYGSLDGYVNSSLMAWALDSSRR
jgi:hypothetical protein